MSVRHPMRKRIHVDKNLLTEDSKIASNKWIVKSENYDVQITLHPTKGYRVQKLEKGWLERLKSKMAEFKEANPEVANIITVAAQPEVDQKEIINIAA